MSESPSGHNNAARCDLLVAGAGPAGLACAIAAAMKGMRVHVVEGREPPIDKACGEGMMPDTLTALAQLGFSGEQLAKIGFPLQGIRFVHRGLAVDARFPGGSGAGVRRTVLHQLLLQRAEELGVTISWKTTFTGLDKDGLATSRGTMNAHWIAGADGSQSRMRRFAGLDRFSASSQRIAVRQHFSVAPWSSLVEVHWTKHAQAYVTPISKSEVCFVFIGRGRFSGIRDALSLFPELRERVRGAEPATNPMGAVTRTRTLRRVTAGNVALIGDASGSVDAVTGEGLALCFRQALTLARALEAGDLSLYEKEHARIFRLPRTMSTALLLMDRYPLALSTAFAGFRRSRELFPRLLELHIGHRPLRLLGSGGLLATLLTVLAP